MKNITIFLDDDTYWRACMIAIRRGISVPTLVRRFLIQLASNATEVEQLKREERALRERITSFRAGDRLSRAEAHDRDL